MFTCQNDTFVFAVYWTDLYDDDIEVFDPLTNYRKVLFETGHRSRPRGIVVDPSTR